MAAAFMVCNCAYADIVYLKNGRKITGKVVVQNEKVIEVDINGGTIVHNTEDVDRVVETNEAIAYAPPKKTGLEKFIDNIKNKVNEYFRRKKREKVIKELHDLRVKEYEYTKKQEAVANTVSMNDIMAAANQASMDAHNAQIKSMKAMAEAMKE